MNIEILRQTRKQLNKLAIPREGRKAWLQSQEIVELLTESKQLMQVDFNEWADIVIQHIQHDRIEQAKEMFDGLMLYGIELYLKRPPRRRNNG